MFLVSCSTDLKLHTYPDYQLAHVYHPSDSTGQIQNISWCKDGSWLVLIPGRGNAQIVRIKENVRLLQSVLGVAQPTTAVFQRNTKRNIAMSTQTGGLLLYDVKTRGIKKRFPSSGLNIRLLDWNVKDNHLAAGCTEGNVILFSNTTNQRVNAFRVPDSNSVSVIRFHPMVRSVLGGASDEGVVSLWDTNTASLKFSKMAHKAPVTDIVFSKQNSNLLTSVSLDRTFQCYDTNKNGIVISVLTDHPLSSVDMAADGFTLAAASSRGMIYIYDLRSYKTPYKTIQAHPAEIKSVRFQPMSDEHNAESITIAETASIESKSDSIGEKLSVDSFSNLLQNVVEFTPTPTVFVSPSCEMNKTASPGCDSFLAEIGNLNNDLKSTSNAEQINYSTQDIVDTIKKLVEFKQTHIQSVSSSNESQYSSTPQQQTSFVSIKKLQTEEIPTSNLSPIQPVISGQDVNRHSPPVFTLQDVEKIVKQELSDFRNIMRSQFLSLQMCIFKQFVMQEERLENLYELMQNGSSSNFGTQYERLQRENAFLRNKLNEHLNKRQ